MVASCRKCAMPKKNREIKATLRREGFCYRPGKGSHSNWYHPLLPAVRITTSGKDGGDADPGLVKEVDDAIEKLNKIRDEEGGKK